MAENLTKKIESIIKTPPFTGLRPFQREEYALFFGRENCVNDILQRLESTTFLAIVGEAYSGKTSLTRCGLENWILQNNITHPTDYQWHIASFRPLSDPFLALSKSLLMPEGLGQPFIHYFESKTHAQRFLNQNLMLSSLSLHTILSQKPLMKGHKLLLICDQFEDIFHLWEKDKKTADEFVNFLIDSSHAHPLKKSTTHDIYVIINLRSSYLTNLPLFPKLEALIKNKLYLLPHLTDKQLTAAITQPIKHSISQLNEALTVKIKTKLQSKMSATEEEIENFYKEILIESNAYYPENKLAHKKKLSKKKPITEVSQKLVDSLLKDIKNKKNALPLLQHILKRMWALDFTPHEHHFTLDIYKRTRIHHLNDALILHLDETYYSLEAEQFKIAEILFRQSANIKKSPTSNILHRPVKIELIAKLADATIKEVINVINIFRIPEREFLTPIHSVELNSKMQIDIAHDVIVIYWKKIKDWQKKEQQTKNNYERLKYLAHEHQKNKGVLLRSSELDKLSHWSKTETFNPIWATYYQCNFKEIKDYLTKSNFYHKYPKYLMGGALISITCLLLFGIYTIYQLQEKKQKVLDTLIVMRNELVTPAHKSELERIFERFTHQTTDNSDAWLYYGLALGYQKKWGEAEITLRKAYELSPNSSEIALELAKILIHKKIYPEALKLLTDAKKNAPNDEHVLEKLGDFSIHNNQLKTTKNKEKEKIQQAHDYYQQALDISPNNNKILNKLAQTLSLLGHSQKALEKLKRSVAINKNNAENRRAYGLELMKNGQINHAIKELQVALDLEPNEDKNWRNLGEALFQNGHLKEAIKVFEKAVILNKDSDKNYRNLGNVLMANKQFNDALKAYTSAQNINPNRVNLTQKAKLLTKLKRIDEANQLYDSAAALKKNNWE